MLDLVYVVFEVGLASGIASALSQTDCCSWIATRIRTLFGRAPIAESAWESPQEPSASSVILKRLTGYRTLDYRRCEERKNAERAELEAPRTTNVQFRLGTDTQSFQSNQSKSPSNREDQSHLPGKKTDADLEYISELEESIFGTPKKKGRGGKQVMSGSAHEKKSNPTGVGSLTLLHTQELEREVVVADCVIMAMNSNLSDSSGDSNGTPSSLRASYTFYQQEASDPSASASSSRPEAVEEREVGDGLASSSTETSKETSRRELRIMQLLELRHIEVEMSLTRYRESKACSDERLFELQRNFERLTEALETFKAKEAARVKIVKSSGSAGF